MNTSAVPARSNGPDVHLTADPRSDVPWQLRGRSSAWENWPRPTGHAPSLAVLDRLAQLYRCNVTDLVTGWGEHASTDGATARSNESDAPAWQVDNLALDEPTRALTHWSERLPETRRRALLLKLSTAAAVSAGHASSPPPSALGTGPDIAELAGVWESTYSYFSTGRNRQFDGHHRIHLRAEGARLLGRSDPNGTGVVELDLRTDGLLVTGSWTERTATDGYYRGAVYHGILQLVLDPTGRSMTGRWLGPDRDFTIDSGTWTLARA